MQHIYHVTVLPDGRWQGGKEKAWLPFFLADTQQEAEELMCGIAMGMGDSHVLVFGAQGVLMRDRVFAPAKECPEVLVLG